MALLDHSSGQKNPAREIHPWLCKEKKEKKKKKSSLARGGTFARPDLDAINRIMEMLRDKPDAFKALRKILLSIDDPYLRERCYTYVESRVTMLSLSQMGESDQNESSDSD